MSIRNFIRTALPQFIIVLIAGIAIGAPNASPTPAPIAADPPATPAVSASPDAKGSPVASTSPKPADTQAQWSQAQRIFKDLSPDAQKKFIDNLSQWRAMSPEEQELLRDRDLLHREKISQEIQDAEKKTGVKLDQDEMEVFALRYTQERRKIEEALRKEIDEKRQIMIDAMMARLRIEFSESTPAPVTVPPDHP